MTAERTRVKISSSAISAEIDPLGAQLYALRDRDGQDLMWNGDPAFWTGRAPILFPVIGMLEHGRYHLNGQIYPLAKHGFARHSLFEVVDTDESSALFRLTADPQTLKVYPFQFELDLHFGVADDTLSLKASVKNLGEGALLASFGFHPALRWPLPYGRPRAEHTVRFGQDEPAPIRRINAEGLVKPEPLPTPVEGQILTLRDSLFEDDALIFDQLKSDVLSFGAPTGPRLEVRFPDTPYLGIWTKPGADFICIEPWHGIADPVGFDKDLSVKPGIFELGAGQIKEIAMSIKWVA